MNLNIYIKKKWKEKKIDELKNKNKIINILTIFIKYYSSSGKMSISLLSFFIYLNLFMLK